MSTRFRIQGSLDKHKPMVRKHHTVHLSLLRNQRRAWNGLKFWLFSRCSASCSMPRANAPHSPPSRSIPWRRHRFRFAAGAVYSSAHSA